MTAQKTAAANARLAQVWNNVTIRQMKEVASHWGGASHSGDYGRMNKGQLIEWLAKQDASTLANIRANALSGLNSKLGLTYDASRAVMAAKLHAHLNVINEVEDDALDVAKANLHATISRVFSDDADYAGNLIALSNA